MNIFNNEVAMDDSINNIRETVKANSLTSFKHQLSISDVDLLV